MNELEKLEQVCLKIDYDMRIAELKDVPITDVIFNQEFMDKYLQTRALNCVNAEEQCRNFIKIDFTQFKSDLLLNLDNVVNYLYELLFNYADKTPEEKCKIQDSFNS